jgi:hypothetical protein
VLLVPVPIQVIAREEKTVLKEQNAVTLRVAGRRYRQKTRSQLPRPIAFEDDFGTRLRRQLVTVDDAAALEMFCETLGIGHVVSMGQKDVGDAAQRLKLLHQGGPRIAETRASAAVSEASWRSSSLVVEFFLLHGRAGVYGNRTH